MEKIREVFSQETKAKEQHKRTIRAKRRQAQAEKLKLSLSCNYNFSTRIGYGF